MSKRKNIGIIVAVCIGVIIAGLVAYLVADNISNRRAMENAMAEKEYIQLESDYNSLNVEFVRFENICLDIQDDSLRREMMKRCGLVRMRLGRLLHELNASKSNDSVDVALLKSDISALGILIRGYFSEIENSDKTEIAVSPDAVDNAEKETVARQAKPKARQSETKKDTAEHQTSSEVEAVTVPVSDARATVYIFYDSKFYLPSLPISINGVYSFGMEGKPDGDRYTKSMRKVNVRGDGKMVVSLDFKWADKPYHSEIPLNISDEGVYYIKIYMEKLWNAVLKKRSGLEMKQLKPKDGLKELSSDKYTVNPDVTVNI